MTFPTDFSCEKYVDVSKLIYQLTNGRVILERLPECLVLKILSAKYFISEIENVEDTEANFKDDKCEAELNFEQDVIDAESKDGGTRLNFPKAYCHRCNYSVNNATHETTNCPKCNQVYTKYECGRCNAQLLTFSAMYNHMLQCDYQCHMKHSNVRRLKNHEDPNKCPHCDRSEFGNNGSRKMHIKYCSKKQSLLSKPVKNGIDEDGKAKDKCDVNNEKDIQVYENGESKDVLDQVILDDDEFEYWVTRIDNVIDSTRKDYLMAHCSNCNETFTGNLAYSKCPKCKETYNVFQCGKCLSQYSRFRSLMCHLYYKCMPYETFFCRKCDYQCHLKSKILRHVQMHKKSEKQPGNHESAVSRFNWCKKKSSFNIKSEVNEKDEETNNDNVAKNRSNDEINIDIELNNNNTDLNYDHAYLTDEKEADYRVVRLDDDNEDDVRKSYLLAYCYDCNETFTNSRLRCPKCKKNYEIFQCGKCQLQFSRFGTLKSHLYYKCTPYESFFCRKCNYQCHMKSTMLKHLKFHTTSTKCPQCQRLFTDYNIAVAHFRSCRMNSNVNINAELNENEAESNGDPATSDEEEAEYQVIQIGDDSTRKNYFIARCLVCKETSTCPYSKCSKCNKDYEIFQCGKCQVQYSDFNNLRKHVYYKCMPHEIYFCRKCDYQCHLKCIILQHIKAHAKSTPCPYCQKQFTNLKTTKSHLKWCGKKNHFFCNFCDYKCINKECLVDHINLKHPNLHMNKSTDKELDVVVRPKCDKRFGAYPNMVSHVKFYNEKPNFRHKKKNDEQSHTNVLSDTDAKTKSDFKEANIGAGSSEKTENDDYRVIRINDDDTRKEYFIAHCYDCNAISTGNLANSHCPKCNKNNHMFECGKCQVQYPLISSLRNHLYYKCNPNVTYICKKCDYSCHMRCGIIAHLNSHAKFNILPECKMQFADHREALAPLQNDNKLVCPKCNKRFTAYGGMSAHIQFCNKERTVECQLCEFKTYNYSNLLKHMKAKHTS